MKKSTLTRFLSMVLLVIMVASMLVSCGDKKSGSNVTNYGDIVIDESDTDENPNIEAIDYDGYEFTFICQPYLDSNAYSVNYMVSDGEIGDTLLDAVYRRNGKLTDKYSIKFAQSQVTDLLTSVRTQVLSGTTDFDLIVGNCMRLSTLARENLLLDLNSIERFDMSKSYWDSNAAEQLKIGDKLYFTNCALNVQEVAFVCYFNKQLIEDYELTSPYEYIENGTWTIDNWAKLVKSVSKDMDGDGQMTELDQYGTLFERHNPRMFLYASGIRTTTNDETGFPQLTLMADKNKTVTAFDKVKAVFQDKTVTWSIEQMSSSDTHGYNDKWDYARSLFCQDLYLFHYEGTNIIHQFADMESEFGIVPLPKYDENQAEFHSQYPVYCAMIAIPSTKTGVDLERTTNIIEDMNYYSGLILEPAWFDVLLSRRYTRDDESEKYLSVIRDSRVYDIGLYYDFGKIRENVLDVDCSDGGANISTTYARYSKSIEADIKATYRDFGLA